MNRRMRWIAAAWVLLAGARAGATANYVYHEQTTATTGGTCDAYLATPAPGPADAYPLRAKVEYQFFTNEVRVYYTTDGSAPAGALGVAAGTTTVATASYACTFMDGGGVVDVAAATIPAQPAGTTVRYAVSAWHSGGGPEVFANSGTCGTCTACTMASCATLFSYTVTGGTPDAGVTDAATVPDAAIPDAATVPDAATPDAAIADAATVIDAVVVPDAASIDATTPAPDAASAVDAAAEGDASADATPGAADDAAAPDARAHTQELGCGCRAGARGRGAPAAALVLAVVLAALRRGRARSAGPAVTGRA